MGKSNTRPNLKNKKKLKGKQQQNYVELASAEDFLTQGTEEEESGDRFTLSDLSKSLRFYQTAYEYYLQSSEIASRDFTIAASATGSKAQVLLDAAYNSSRLIFHVYNEFVKEDTINFKLDVKSIDNVVNSRHSILQTLPEIAHRHEEAIAAYQKVATDDADNGAKPVAFPWDLYYNACLVYTELVEDSVDDNLPVDEFVAYVTRAVDLFMEILQFQVVELTNLVEEMRGNGQPENDSAHDHDHNHGNCRHDHSQEEADEEDNNDDEEDEKEFSSQEAIVPSTVLETIISIYGFIQAVHESINLNQQYMINFNQKVHPQLQEFDQLVETVLGELVSQFSPSQDGAALQSNNEKGDDNDMLEPLSRNDLIHLEIIKTAIRGLEIPVNSLSSLTALWDQKLKDLGLAGADVAVGAVIFPEKYSLIADNFQNFYDKFQLHLENVEEGGNNDAALAVATHWKLLAAISSYYRKSQAIYTHLLKQTQQRAKANANESIELSPLVSQLALILVSLADIDVIRVNHPHFQPDFLQPVLSSLRELSSDSQVADILSSIGKAQPVLAKNLQTYLKNALAYINGVNCGLRERIFDKLAKRQKKNQVLARQYVLKAVPEGSIMVRGEAERELLKVEVAELKDVEGYKGLSFPF